MAEVFVSYSRANEAVAKRVENGLKASGFQAWRDDQLPAHRAYSEIIEERLHGASAVVVLWSKEAAQSQWVRAEADFARTHGKLVQAQLDGTLPPLPFNQIQCADLRGWRGGASHAGWAKLQSSVKALVSGEDQASQAPVRPRWWEHRSARWAGAAAALLILIAAGLLLFWNPFAPTEHERPVLAVLPFESLDDRDASLVSGIWEDTRQAIGRNPQLLVLGPNSAEELAERGMDATRLAADYVLEASVRSVGDRIRVNTNLVRTEDGAQIWSENFDRKLDDVFVLQSEIAAEIEGRVRGRLATGGGVQPENIATTGEVYALYSDARAKIRKRQMHRYAEAAEQLERVVAMDPNFAPGWATLSVIKGFGLLGKEGSPEEAEGYAKRAITIAPNLAAGHAALGFALKTGPVAEAALRRAIALDPNDFEALHWLGNSLDKSRVQERLQLYSRAVEIEPLFWPTILAKLDILKQSGGVAAMEQERARLEQLGDERHATVVKIFIADEKGDLSQAAATGLDYYRRAAPADREFIGRFFFMVLYQLGLMDLGDEMFPPPKAYIPLIRKNDPGAIEMIEAQHSPQDFWTFGNLAIVGARVYLLNGQGPRLAKQYRAVASSPGQFEAVVGKEGLADVAPGVALALRSAGDDEQATRLLELAAHRAAEFPAKPLDQQIRLARIYAVQGRKDQAIGLLSSAVRRGWIPPFLPINTDIATDPPLAELKSDPRFEKLRQQIFAYLRKERAELGPVRLRARTSGAQGG